MKKVLCVFLAFCFASLPWNGVAEVMDEVVLANLSNTQLLSLREQIETEHFQRLFEDREEIYSLFLETLAVLGYPCELSYSYDGDMVADRSYINTEIGSPDSPEYFEIYIAIGLARKHSILCDLFYSVEKSNISELREAVFVSFFFALCHYENDILLADRTACAEELERLRAQVPSIYPEPGSYRLNDFEGYFCIMTSPLSNDCTHVKYTLY